MNATEKSKIYKPSKLQADQLLKNEPSFKSNHQYSGTKYFGIQMGSQCNDLEKIGTQEKG